MTPPPFPNPERILVEASGALAAGTPPRWEAGGVTPAELQEKVPFVRFQRIGGPSDTVNDYPFVTVEVFATTIAEAIDIAEEHRALLVGGHIRNSHGQIDRAICTSAHTELPAPDPNLRRITTTYRCTLRRLTVAL